MNNKYLTIKEAAEFLGVTPLTLRNWDKNGKLEASRHPMSNYRIYKLSDLEKLSKEIESGEVKVKVKPHKKKIVKLIVKHLSD
jgi:MerR family copper efflux transcriptional regulator